MSKDVIGSMGLGVLSSLTLGGLGGLFGILLSGVGFFLAGLLGAAGGYLFTKVIKPKLDNRFEKKEDKKAQ